VKRLTETAATPVPQTLCVELEALDLEQLHGMVVTLANRLDDKDRIASVLLDQAHFRAQIEIAPTAAIAAAVARARGASAH